MKDPIMLDMRGAVDEWAARRRAEEEARPKAPKPGHWLYASCSALDYGQILRVGKDANGMDIVDIRVLDASDLTWTPLADNDKDSSEFGANPLIYAELPPGVHVILRDVQYRMSAAGSIECDTPGNHCFRCTKFFILREKPTFDGYAPTADGAALGKFFREREAMVDDLAERMRHRP